MDIFRILIESPSRRSAICDRCILSGCDGLAETLSLCRGARISVRPHYDADFSNDVMQVLSSLQAVRDPGQTAENQSCSFCDAVSEERIQLMIGANGSICERCIVRCCPEIVPPRRALDLVVESAFSAVVIEREMLDEPSAMWSAYAEESELEQLEGFTWREIPSALLYRHRHLLGCAGDNLFRATLPAYLRHALHEQGPFRNLSWNLGWNLANPATSQNRLDGRLAILTRAQRHATRDVLAHLATHDAAIAYAHRTWCALTSATP